jgi:hypothetical protein
MSFPDLIKIDYQKTEGSEFRLQQPRFSLQVLVCPPTAGTHSGLSVATGFKTLPAVSLRILLTIPPLFSRLRPGDLADFQYYSSYRTTMSKHRNIIKLLGIKFAKVPQNSRRVV